ncbi:hypothetical protein ABIE40_005872 [Rhizobium sp. OAE497]
MIKQIALDIARTGVLYLGYAETFGHARFDQSFRLVPKVGFFCVVAGQIDNLLNAVVKPVYDIHHDLLPMMSLQEDRETSYHDKTVLPAFVELIDAQRQAPAYPI